MSTAEGNNVVPTGGGERQQGEAAAMPNMGVENFMSIMARYFVMFFVVRMFTEQLANHNNSNINNTNGQHSNQNNMISKTQTLSCAWDAGNLLDVNIYVTEDDSFFDTDTKKKKKKNNKVLLEWHKSDLRLYDLNSNTQANVTIPLSRAVQYNESNLYAHVEVIRQQSKEEDQSAQFNRFHETFLLTKHKVRKGKREVKSLLESSNNEIDDITITLRNSKLQSETKSDNPLSLANQNTTHNQNLLYLRPTLALQWVPQTFAFADKKAIPETMSKHMTSWVNDTVFHPILYRSEFWTTNEQLVLVNETVHEFPLLISLETTSMWKWQLMSQMEASWEQQKNYNNDDDASNDMFRTMLLETNPYLLAVTAIVSVLHTVFDILAFKNDISFFKNKKSMAGLSLRSMIVNAVFQLIILFYLADNETSFMVLMSNGMGLLIEFWKISKAVKLDIDIPKRTFAFQWRDNSNDNNDTDLHTKTREYDDIAMTHLLYITMPLVAGYGTYSLFHRKHKGWISWILNTLVGFIYMFGFINMTPQLFINYKLKSVAHLNWRTLTYKSINTFIDDLFAFIIKMPIMHRLACLRDDLIFFIYCYQRYAYKTDYTRVNEYGQCAAPTEEMLKEQEQEKNATTTQTALATNLPVSKN